MCIKLFICAYIWRANTALRLSLPKSTQKGSLSFCCFGGDGKLALVRQQSKAPPNPISAPWAPLPPLFLNVFLVFTMGLQLTLRREYFYIEIDPSWDGTGLKSIHSCLWYGAVKALNNSSSLYIWSWNLGTCVCVWAPGNGDIGMGDSSSTCNKNQYRDGRQLQQQVQQNSSNRFGRQWQQGCATILYTGIVSIGMGKVSGIRQSNKLNNRHS